MPALSGRWPAAPFPPWPSCSRTRTTERRAPSAPVSGRTIAYSPPVYWATKSDQHETEAERVAAGPLELLLQPVVERHLGHRLPRAGMRALPAERRGRLQRPDRSVSELLGELELRRGERRPVVAARQLEDAVHPTLDDRRERGHGAVGAAGEAAQPERLRDLRVALEIQFLAIVGGRLCLARGSHDAGIAAGLDRHEEARAEVEGASEAAHESQDHLVRPETGAALAHQALKGAAHGSLAGRAAGVLPVPDARMESGAELRQVDGSGESVVGAGGERDRGSVRVRLGDEHHDRRRRGVRVAQGGPQTLGRCAREGD